MEESVYHEMWSTLKKEVDFNLVELQHKKEETESPGLKKAKKMIEHLEAEFIKES